MNNGFRTVAAGVLLLGVSACSALDRAEASPSPAPGSEAEKCENEFYPAARGASWSYAVTGGSSRSFTRTILDVTSTGFTDQDTFSDGASHTRLWKCDDDALTAQQPDEAATAPIEFYSRMHNFQTSMADGVTIPDQFIPGATWNEELLLQGTSLVNGQDVPAKDTIKFECNAGNVEAVSVPAGSFQAIRADCRFDEKIDLTSSAGQTNEIITGSTVWYASGVGLVKSEQVAPDGKKTTVELSSYHLP